MKPTYFIYSVKYNFIDNITYAQTYTFTTITLIYVNFTCCYIGMYVDKLIRQHISYVASKWYICTNICMYITYIHIKR